MTKFLINHDENGFIKAKYHGLSYDECHHIIMSYLDFTGYGDLIEEHPTAECNSTEQPQSRIDEKYDRSEPFIDWWNDYISDEEGDFVEENVQSKRGELR